MRHVRTHAWLACVAATLVVAVLGFGLVATHTAHASAALQGTASVTVSPDQADLQCGETATIDFRINDVQNLFGIDVKITYDPSILEVVDADHTALGLQVQPGDLPDVSKGQGLVQVNAVDSTAGTIDYAAIRLNPAPAQSGSGVMFSVSFKGKADGTSAIEYQSVLLSDATANQILANQVNGQINVDCAAEPTATTVPGPTATPVPGDECIHVVQPGETLYSIAAMYGTTVQAIMDANGLTNPHHIYVGQKLVIPNCTKPSPTAVPTGVPPTDKCQHIVQPGDTLYSIARLYGTTVDALMTANGLADPNYIVVGHVLVIPGCTPGPGPGPVPPVEPPAGCFPYTVQPGDSLSSIALKHCDSIYEIAQRNGLVNPDLIRVGQVLTICGCGMPPSPAPCPGPGPCPGGPCRDTYTVQPCDTLYSIGLRYRVSAHTLAAANGLANPNLIYVGQQLCIP